MIKTPRYLKVKNRTVYKEIMYSLKGGTSTGITSLQDKKDSLKLSAIKHNGYKDGHGFPCRG